MAVDDDIRSVELNIASDASSESGLAPSAIEGESVTDHRSGRAGHRGSIRTRSATSCYDVILESLFPKNAVLL